MEQLTLDDVRAYRIHAADLRVDRVSGNTDMRHRTFVDELVRIARHEELDVLHVFGAFELRPSWLRWRGRGRHPAHRHVSRLGPGHPHLRQQLRPHAGRSAAPPPASASTPARRVVERVLQPQATVYEIPNHIEPEPADGAPPARPLEPRRRAGDRVRGRVSPGHRAGLAVGGVRPGRRGDAVPGWRSSALSATRRRTTRRSSTAIPSCSAFCAGTGGPRRFRPISTPAICSSSRRSATAHPTRCWSHARRASIIAAPVGGILEMIRHEREGLLVDPRHRRPGRGHHPPAA
ncbi:MAG: hypothetical protein R3A10_02050 [Caldilineaceae bacterium]